MKSKSERHSAPEWDLPQAMAEDGAADQTVEYLYESD
jgi:hypothetical protein